MIKIQVLVPEKIRSSKLLREIDERIKALEGVFSRPPMRDHDIEIERVFTEELSVRIIIKGDDLVERMEATQEITSSICSFWNVSLASSEYNIVHD